MAETTIRPALAAQELAVDLIAEHHDHLEDARILWLYTSAKRKKANRVLLGTAARLGVVARYLSSGLESIDTGYDFMIMLSERQWGGLTPAQRLALVDHCLCRCGQRVTVNRRTGGETKTWCTLAPDVEEFSAVVERHGLWLKDQQEFHRRAGRQLPLDEPDVPPPAARRTTTDADSLVVKTEVESPTTNGVDHEPGWQEKTGIGASEHEQRRRRRGKSEAGHAVATPS